MLDSKIEILALKVLFLTLSEKQKLMQDMWSMLKQRKPIGFETFFILLIEVPSKTYLEYT